MNLPASAQRAEAILPAAWTAWQDTPLQSPHLHLAVRAHVSDSQAPQHHAEEAKAHTDAEHLVVTHRAEAEADLVLHQSAKADMARISM